METKPIKLTPKQNAVVWCLQNGWVLITDNTMKGAIVGSKTMEYHINNGLFYRLVNMGVIGQSIEWPFDYGLTKMGREIKTKPVDLTINT